MGQRILVPLDGSPRAAQAVPYAALLARRCGAELLVARAIDLDEAPRPGETAAETREATWTEAQRQVDGLKVDPELRGPAVETALELGPPAHVIVRLARERQVSLIVMATRRHAGASHWSMGSVAGHVLRQAHLPVLLLTTAALAHGGAERLLRPLLVPLDGSALSEQVLPVAMGLASCLHIPVTLVRALEPYSFVGFPARAVAPYGTELERTAREAERTKATTALEAIARRWRQAGVATAVAVEVGTPAAVIEEVTRKTGAGWLAMASHGRGGLSGLLLGSTALSVLQHTALPALITAVPTLEPRGIEPPAGESGSAKGKPAPQAKG